MTHKKSPKSLECNLPLINQLCHIIHCYIMALISAIIQKSKQSTLKTTIANVNTSLKHPFDRFQQSAVYESSATVIEPKSLPTINQALDRGKAMRINTPVVT